MPLAIRRIRVDDAAVSRALRLRALASDPLSFGSTYDAELAHGDDFWQERAKRHTETDDCAIFLALRDGDAVGLVRGGRDETRPDVFFVHSMWVAPEVRGAGVAGDLLRALEDWIASRGGTICELMVADAAPAARRLYERSGYVADGYTEPSPHPGIIEHRMQKRLPG